MRKRINTLNCLFGIMLTAIVIVPFSPLHAKANNHADISYHIPYSGTGVARTDLATKTDSTSVYIKHGGDRGVTVGIGVEGYGGNYTGMHGGGNFVPVPLGSSYKITNYVAESFPNDYNKGRYHNIYLKFRTSSGGRSLHVVWSPDSI